jgi:hypothetical protein
LNKNSATIFKITSNPSENLNVQWLSKNPGTMRIYNNTGIMFFEKNIHPGNHQFVLPSLVNGVYFVQGISNDHSEMKKFVKH